MSRNEILGSWHNSSYYGHQRSKPRTDYIIEYRRLAAPLPPRLFSQRSETPASCHLFSKHDNRQSQINLSLYFEEGIGRKRAIETSNNKSDRNLLTWQPSSVTSLSDENNATSGLTYNATTSSLPSNSHTSDSDTTEIVPLSSYTVDYRGVSVNVDQLNQRLVRRLRAQSKEDTSPPTTVYRRTHCTPNLRSDGFVTDDLPRTSSSAFSCRMVKHRSPYCKDTVGHCLTWYQPLPEVARQTPASQNYDFSQTGISSNHEAPVKKGSAESDDTKLVLI